MHEADDGCPTSWRRLVKLLQRNKATNPPDEFHHKWQDYCEQVQQGVSRPIKDPHKVPPEVVQGFLLEDLPRVLWEMMVQKVQGDRWKDAWSQFCTDNAPEHRSGDPVRDPKRLDTALLVDFIATTLMRDDEIAILIDSFTFDFSRPIRDKPRGPTGPIAPAPMAPPRVMDAPGPPRRPQSSQPPPGPPGKYTLDIATGILGRLVKLLQRNKSANPADALAEQWNIFCDTKGPRDEDDRPIRDPKLVPRQGLEYFLIEQLPGQFWVMLVQRIHGGKTNPRWKEMWEEFCERRAPPIRPGAAPTLDPRRLDVPLLVEFVAHALNNDGEIAEAIDTFSFDFADRAGGGPRKGQPHEQPRQALPPPSRGAQRRSRSPRRPQQKQDKKGESPSARFIKFLQRNKKVQPKDEFASRWNKWCDTNAPADERGRRMRDPARNPEEVIINFCAEQIPHLFWVALAEDIRRVPDLAQGFTDRFGDTDPELLDTVELVGCFIETLEQDDRFIAVIDSFQGNLGEDGVSPGHGMELSPMTNVKLEDEMQAKLEPAD